MKTKRLSLKKEIVANLNDTALSQIRGGETGDGYCSTDQNCPSAGGSCFCYNTIKCDPGTEWSYCCSETYAGFDCGK